MIILSHWLTEQLAGFIYTFACNTSPISKPVFRGNKLTNMSKYCRDNIETTAIRLPSHDQAAYYSLYSYFQRTIDKVRTIHQQITSKFPSREKGRDYARVTNEEIIQRGCFLHYVYNCLLSLYELSQEWKITISETSRPEGAFKVFLNDLIFSSSDLTKISRFKRNNFAQNEFCLKINQALLNILFQTEIYIYQILLRIFKIRLMDKEHKKIARQLEKMKQKHSFSSQLFTAKTSPSKREQMACKALMKQIEQIYTYYHCDVSISREECNTKPEIQCLIHLLKEKESESFLAMLKSGCKQLFNVPDVAIVYNEVSNQIHRQQQEVKQLQSTTEKQVYEEIPVIETIPEKQEHNQSQLKAADEPQQVEESPDNLIVVADEYDRAASQEKEEQKEEDEKYERQEENQEERQEGRQEERLEQREEEERVEQREEDEQKEEVVSQERQNPVINKQKDQSHQQQKKPKKPHPSKHTFDLTKWALSNPMQKTKPNPKPSKSTSKGKTTFNTTSSRFINCSFRLYKFKEPSNRNKVKEKRRDDLKRYRVDDPPKNPFTNYKRQRSDVAEDCLAQQTPIRNRVFVPSNPSKNQ